jgi:hypothetical protein
MNIGSQTSQSQAAWGYLNTLVMVTNGGVYTGMLDTLSAATNNFTQPGLASTVLASMCWLNPNVFIVTGQSTVPFLILSTNALSTLPISTSTGSTATNPFFSITPTFCSLTANWRGRLILTQDQNNPQNVYASRLGTPTDFDYALTDPAAAWAANFSESGQVGEPVTAFIPFNDDLAIVSCINSVWLIEGDPSDGGSFVLLSQDMGIVGPRAWCTDAAHTLYFVGTSGLYSLRPFWAQYQPPQNLTDRSWQQFFQAIDRNQSAVNLVYDELNQYINIFVQPYNGSTGSHLIYDIRNGGVWPVQYGGDAQPISAISYVPGYAAPATDANGWPIGPVIPQQTIAIGGTSSCVYQVSPSTLGDYTITSSFAISSYANFMAVNPIPDGVAVSHALELDMGELPPQYNTTGAGWYAEATLFAGPTAADVSDDYTYPTLDSTSNSTSYLTWNGSTNLDRRQTIWRPRLGGAWFALQIGNSTASTTWSFEQAILTSTPSGINRFRR